MSETTETKAKKAPAKKPAAKKAAKKKTVKKAAAKKVVKKTAGTDAPKKRGRPPGSKTAAKKVGRPAGKGRRKVGKGAKTFAYQLITTKDDGAKETSAMNGPFVSENAALDDASIMADENTTIVLYREAKRGRVQKSTKFVAGR